MAHLHHLPHASHALKIVKHATIGETVSYVKMDYKLILKDRALVILVIQIR
jgi:hypothetical protein